MTSNARQKMLAGEGSPLASAEQRLKESFYGVASLPLATPVELQVIFEVSA